MIPGWSSTDPLKLCPCVLQRYTEVVESCYRDGVRLILVETLRDVVRQAHYVAHGVSRTMDSLHLPQAPFGLALAVDAVPKSVTLLKNWGPGHADWLTYTRHARAFGLLCGADWAGQDKGWDWPHLELKKCQCPPALPEEPKRLEA